MEQEFRKDGQTRYAYNPTQVVNLKAGGWVEVADDPYFDDWHETPPKDEEKPEDNKEGK
jgi:hypothetical protein